MLTKNKCCKFKACRFGGIFQSVQASEIIDYAESETGGMAWKLGPAFIH